MQSMTIEQLRTASEAGTAIAPSRARRFGQQLRDRTLLLAQHQETGRTGRPGLPAFVRELIVHRNDIVFYRVLDDVATVEILRVKHAAQRLPAW